METIVITSQSGVAFEVEHTPKVSAPDRWTVIGSIGRQSTTAEAIVGMVFMVGDPPLWYAKGYAQIVQRGLNKHHNLHSAFGIAKPSTIIEEVRP